eukprot:scaffold54138_cov44-Phaeocystis_antarctica.AAC.1
MGRMREETRRNDGNDALRTERERGQQAQQAQQAKVQTLQTKLQQAEARATEAAGRAHQLEAKAKLQARAHARHSYHALAYLPLVYRTLVRGAQPHPISRCPLYIYICISGAGDSHSMHTSISGAGDAQAHRRQGCARRRRGGGGRREAGGGQGANPTPNPTPKPTPKPDPNPDPNPKQERATGLEEEKAGLATQLQEARQEAQHKASALREVLRELEP